MGRRSIRRLAWVASQRLAALRSQSCFSAPSWGAMNSGIMGKAMAWPGATTVPAKCIQGLVKGGLQVRGRHWVEHGADMVVGRDGGHAEQALAVRHLPPFLQRALVGEER